MGTVAASETVVRWQARRSFRYLRGTAYWLAVAVASLSLIQPLKECLSGLGYIYRGDGGNQGGQLFVRESVPSVRVIHLHVVQRDDPQWRDWLLFRDTLRTDASLREQYAQLKRSLAQRYADDRGSYTAGKDAFIRQLLERRRTAD